VLALDLYKLKIKDKQIQQCSLCWWIENQQQQ
jgi:hypothetical protein